MNENKQPPDVNTPIKLELPLGAVNVILGTLDKNPLGAPVMQMATLITSVKTQAEKQLAAQEKLDQAPPADKTA